MTAAAGVALGLAAVPLARAQQAAGYAGSQECTTACHEQEAARFLRTPMGRVFLEGPRSDLERQGCEACHGPGKAHVESGGEDMTGMIRFARNSTTPADERNRVCIQCHEKTARLYWQASPHEASEVACSDCHNVMTNVSERANLQKPTVMATCTQCHLQRQSQQMRSSRMPLWEQKMQCSSCHNPHGSPNEKLLVASSVNETCYNCHTEKRGPFLWEHPPVVESCSNCHEPHGSTKEKMLKLPKPRLCQQCHDPTRHPTRSLGPADTKYVMGRQCANCHTMIHGSNHPSGFAFTR
jgi:DmsE family decaheme c-type cytochrome